MQYWFNLLFKNQAKRIYWGIFWAFFTAFSGVALLALSGWFITATALSGIALGIGAAVAFDMYMPGSGIRFFALSRTLGRYTERIYNHDTILRLVATFRLSLFKSLSGLGLSELHNTTDSEWLGKLTADVDALDSLLIRYIIPPIGALLLVVAVTFFLSFMSIEFALVFGAFMLFCCVVSIGFTIKHTAHLATSSAGILGKLRAHIIEHLQGSMVLQCHQLMGLHETRMLCAMDTFSALQNRLAARLANIQLVLDMALGMALTMLVLIGLYAAQHDYIEGPSAVMLVLLFMGASELIQSLPSQFSTWGKTKFSAHRLKTLMTQPPERKRRKAPTINMLTVHITHHPKILSSQSTPVSFGLAKQNCLLVLGRSGSGKSTLAQLIVGNEEYNASTSDISINNRTSLHTIVPTDWYKCLGFLEQSNTILAGTLGYNLALGLPKATEDELWSVLKMVELAEWAQSLPNGLDTWLGESGGKTSGGQARRICLCRILLRQGAQLVILDEPFNGVDAQMGARIWANISPWLEQRMVLLLSHERPTFLRQSEQVQTLDLDNPQL